MISPYQAISLILVILLFLLVLKAQKKKEAANHIAKVFCRRNGLQILDGTVAFRGLHFDKSSVSLVYRFRFEYSVNSTDRYSGNISFVGDHVQSLFVDPEHIDETKTVSPD